MSFVQDQNARRFFTAGAALCAAALLLAVLLAVFYAHGLHAVLFARERTLAAALLEQGVPPADAAQLLAYTQTSDQADALLLQLGRDAPFWLLEPVCRRAAAFLPAALLGASLPALLQLAAACRFLSSQDRLYRDAAACITRFAHGDFSRRLPRAQPGALSQLFAAVDQLSTALQAGIDAEQRAKTFLQQTISDISHQLKTPLAALHMYAEIIAAEPDHTDTVCAFTEKSLVSLARMERLTSTLLRLAQLDAGNVPFHRQTLQAAALAARASAELQTRAMREGKRLTLSGNPSALLYCDPDWTAEALCNLIQNAIDHTARGGEITVRWEQTPAMCRITVADTGEGIAAEDLHHIFKRFYRSASAATTQGVGLGLPLARAVIEGQGGLLSAESTPGRGTAFTAALPPPPDAPQPSPPR